MARRQVKAEAGSIAASVHSNNARLDAMAEIGEQFAAWRPASEVLTRVRAVETIFPHIDMITRVGGWPIERITMVHGPSNEGKTGFCLGLELSFLLRGHFAFHIDAEYATPEPWVKTLMNEYSTHPAFRALRPHTYEETADAVRQACNVLTKAKANGRLPPDTSMLFVVDSLRKLVPKNLLATIMKGAGGDEPETKSRFGKKQKGIDGANGRAAQIKAAINAQWLDELVPMLAESGAAMVLVARESEDADIFGDGYKVGGGRAPFYESSLVARITRDHWVRESSETAAAVYGECHRVELRKTKVAGRTEKVPVGFFHTSNGVLTPAGFDRARDVLTLALDRGVAALAGSWVIWGTKKLGQGLNTAVKKLSVDADLLGELEAELRLGFKQDDPLMVGTL